ncbi:hypothetical protein BDA96_07G057200 [Sorghum bicolor]|uniref:Uncharacterized protein n=3 Tax=Sorghum bicolor TaxID=4558 RepID=A0A921QKZ0_SORBI|nr:hypothetical protein BDA96_07G057200 [Sorghum bicolor]KXG24525.1 hypothetical protein SORBI_3007G054600 [Sorghum bicolor]
MARAMAPSRHPPSAMAAAAAAAVAAASPPPAAAVPQRRGAFSRSHQPHRRHHHRLVPGPPTKAKQRASCACSPTTHPGSYRCALHRGQGQAGGGGAAGPPLPVAAAASAAPVSSRLSAPRRASMANPLVRIAAVEGSDHIRRALAALVRPPPSQTTRRRADAFRPTPSRLSAMSSASS